MAAVTQNEMISANVPIHIYNQLTEAASLIGATISQFLIQSAVEKAEAILERERVIKMTKQDAEVFFDAIENPPPINDKLLMAMQAYQEAFPNAENRGT